MITIGLTGSIGMGKSTTANMFKSLGVPVYDADAAVHEAYKPGGIAVKPVGDVFPAAIGEDGGIDRKALKSIVLSNSKALKTLERIVHPLIVNYRTQFLAEQEQAGHDIVLLDIPLLFETGSDDLVDYVVVVSAPFSVQKQRVMQREGMTEEIFQSILAQQVPDANKRSQADFVIDTSLGFDHAQKAVRDIIETIKNTHTGKRKT